MWDEIKLTVGSATAAYAVLSKLQEAADAETEKDTAEAESEWRQAAGSVMLRDFGAKPTVGLRPGSGSGMDVVVRFVTRASERFERRNRLYDAMTEILRDPLIDVRPEVRPDAKTDAPNQPALPAGEPK